ncbi:MAG: hypothetical protein COA78_10075 [Blastopirellula sp.]|nr:MAG: hypothetical protein COA78_10075 [Blastopirellula sp.]
MINRGSLLVYGILAVATAAGIVTLIFTWSRGNQALEYWGTESAFEIRHAATIELITILQVEDPDIANDLAAFDLSNGSKKWKIIKRIDITKARGLTHMQQALIEDASYQWGETDVSCTPEWKHALVFTGKKQPVTILIDLNCGQLIQQGKQQNLVASPILKAGLQTVFDEQLNTGAGQ